MEFRCLRCGRCCRSLAPIVVLSDVEEWMKRGAWHVIEAIEVVKASGFPRSLGVELCFTLRRRGNACYFYRKGVCTIYDLRPAVCRLFPFAYSEEGVAVHPWALRNCPAVRLYGGRPPGEEVRELAREIMRELLGLPFYTTIVEELIASTGRVFPCNRFRVNVGLV
ncbi:MAG: YkgJ family cysteine cluster protein [Thermofilaceae archaeon]